jgi:hypothetical protein
MNGDGEEMPTTIVRWIFLSCGREFRIAITKHGGLDENGCPRLGKLEAARA